MKTFVQCIAVFLFAVLQGFASEYALPHATFEKQSEKNQSVVKATVYVANYASQPEHLTLAFESSNTSSYKITSNDGWHILKAHGKQFSFSCRHHFVRNKTLFVSFNKPDIIFPFHHHW